jgi:hypothetical protein
LKSTPFCGNLPENVKALKAQAWLKLAFLSSS